MSGSWAGLVPQEEPEGESGAALLALKANLGELASQVQWISGVRTPPPRLATYGGGVIPTLRSDGEDAAEHLFAAKLRSTADPVLAMAQTFFNAIGEQLDLDNPTNGAWRVLLQPIGAPNVRANLCDTGEGYAQVLPVLVALARACVGGGPRLLCLEQPELHLHTRAQLALAKVLIESAHTRARRASWWRRTPKCS